MDGKILPLEKAKVSVLDHGFLYGDSVYETLRTVSGYPFQMKGHMDRLFHSAEGLQLSIPTSKKRISAEILKTAMAYWKKFEKTDLYIRVIVSRGFGDIGFDLSLCKQATIIIIMKAYRPTPLKLYKTGITMALVQPLRNHPRAINPNIKSGNYLNNLLAYLQAIKHKAQDAIMQNREGYLTEGTTNNFFLIKNQTVLTPSLGSGILKGLTRSLLIETAKIHHIPVLETKIKPEALLSADECFITSTLKAILPVTRCVVDGKTIPIGTGKPGPLTLHLMDLFKTEVQKNLQEEYCLDS